MNDKRGVLIEIIARNKTIFKKENITWNISSLGRSKNKNYLTKL
jgi:hypothetical protein